MLDGEVFLGVGGDGEGLGHAHEQLDYGVLFEGELDGKTVGVEAFAVQD